MIWGCYANRQTAEFTDAMYNLPESELHKQFARSVRFFRSASPFPPTNLRPPMCPQGSERGSVSYLTVLSHKIATSSWVEGNPHKLRHPGDEESSRNGIPNKTAAPARRWTTDHRLPCLDERAGGP